MTNLKTKEGDSDPLMTTFLSLEKKYGFPDTEGFHIASCNTK